MHARFPDCLLPAACILQLARSASSMELGHTACITRINRPQSGWCQKGVPCRAARVPRTKLLGIQLCRTQYPIRSLGECDVATLLAACRVFADFISPLALHWMRRTRAFAQSFFSQWIRDSRSARNAPSATCSRRSRPAPRHHHHNNNNNNNTSNPRLICLAPSTRLSTPSCSSSSRAPKKPMLRARCGG